MSHFRFSLPSLFGLISAVAAGLGAWLNASVSVLTALFAVTVLELVVAAAAARSACGATRAFCGGFAMAGSLALMIGCAYLWVAHDALNESWFVHLVHTTRRPHGWIVRDRVATDAVMCVCFALLAAFAGGWTARWSYQDSPAQPAKTPRTREQTTNHVEIPG